MVRVVHIVTRIEKRFRSDFKAIPNRVNLRLYYIENVVNFIDRDQIVQTPIAVVHRSDVRHVRSRHH